MKKGGGKQKGTSFERVLCKALSLWVSDGQREDLYWRSAMSGGRATVAKKKGKDLANVAGDICAVHPDGNALTDTYFIEAKHLASLNYAEFILKDTGKIADYWKKAHEQAAAHRKIPMLILKQNFCPVVAAFPLRRLCIEPLAHIFKRDCTMVFFDDLTASPFQQFMSVRRLLK